MDGWLFLSANTHNCLYLPALELSSKSRLIDDWYVNNWGGCAPGPAFGRRRRRRPTEEGEDDDDDVQVPWRPFYLSSCISVCNTYNTVMILPQVHLRKPCYDFYFL